MRFERAAINYTSGALHLRQSSSSPPPPPPPAPSSPFSSSSPPPPSTPHSSSSPPSSPSPSFFFFFSSFYSSFFSSSSFSFSSFSFFFFSFSSSSSFFFFFFFFFRRYNLAFSTYTYYDHGCSKPNSTPTVTVHKILSPSSSLSIHEHLGITCYNGLLGCDVSRATFPKRRFPEYRDTAINQYLAT